MHITFIQSAPLSHSPHQNIYFTCHKAMPNSQRKLSSIACSFVTMHLLKLAEFYYKKEEKEN